MKANYRKLVGPVFGEPTAFHMVEQLSRDGKTVTLSVHCYMPALRLRKDGVLELRPNPKNKP